MTADCAKAGREVSLTRVCRSVARRSARVTTQPRQSGSKANCPVRPSALFARQKDAVPGRESRAHLARLNLPEEIAWHWNAYRQPAAKRDRDPRLS